jgi:hypothetical protein
MVHESGITPLGSVQTGSDAIVYLALSAELEGITGKYFDQKRESRAESQACDSGFRIKLCQFSESLTSLQNEQKQLVLIRGRLLFYY